MRIAYVCTDPGVPVFGSKGASAHAQSVLAALLRRGHDVHLVTPRPGGAGGPGLRGVRVHPLPVPRSPSPAERERLVQRSDAAAAAVLDDMHDHGRLDLVYERYSLWGRTAMRWAAERDVPSLLEVNAPLVEEQARHRVLVDRAGAEEASREAMSCAGAVLCVSDAVARFARGLCPDPSRVHTLANGVDTGRVRPSGRPAAPARGPFTIGFVGTLKPWHGVETLLDAVATLVRTDPDYALLVVGDGPLRHPLEERARSLGIAGHLRTTGAVAPADVPALLHRMDVAVAPYPPTDDFYFSPLKVYEYLAAGLPVVASAVGDLPRLLGHGSLGVLVPPGDPDALADAVAGLRGAPQRRAALGREARRRAVLEHDWSGVVDTALTHARLGPTPGPTEVRRAALR